MALGGIGGAGVGCGDDDIADDDGVSTTTAGNNDTSSCRFRGYVGCNVVIWRKLPQNREIVPIRRCTLTVGTTSTHSTSFPALSIEDATLELRTKNYHTAGYCTAAVQHSVPPSPMFRNNHQLCTRRPVRRYPARSSA